MLNLVSIKNTGVFLAVILSLSIVTSCSSQNTDEVLEEPTVSQNPLAELTFATDSSDAYKRACYWGSQGNNIFLYDRIKEGNELAEQEGKLPLAGLEQAMGIVLQKGEPQAPEELELVKSFCTGLGIPF